MSACGCPCGGKCQEGQFVSQGSHGMYVVEVWCQCRWCRGLPVELTLFGSGSLPQKAVGVERIVRMFEQCPRH